MNGTNMEQAKLDQLTYNIELVKKWFDTSSHYLKGMYVLTFDIDTTPEEPIARTHIYTKDNLYSIIVKRDYLGCTSVNRRNNIGEGWSRGRDFPDGCFNEQTWNDIIKAIAFHEFEGTAGNIKETGRGK